MRDAGFTHWTEWWHFSLTHEPYPNTGLTFPLSRTLKRRFVAKYNRTPVGKHTITVSKSLLILTTDTLRLPPASGVMRTNNEKYQRLAEQVENKIASGIWQPAIDYPRFEGAGRQ